MITPEAASSGLLIIFVITWLAAALWAGRKTGSMALRELAPLYAGGLLFCIGFAAAVNWIPAMEERLWPSHPALEWPMVALCGAGLAFCWWARLHLGRLWAGGVIVREGHRVVDTGPYALVRHPIYSGAFVALVAAAAVRARPAAIGLAVGLIVFFALKARIEERFLRQELGAAYDEYQARVPMLVPGLR